MKKSGMKKWLWGMGVGSAVLIVAAFLLGKFVFPSYRLPDLPKPEVAEGQRGMLGIDKNVNEATIDNFLGRSDAVYRDMRLLRDPGNYAAIGGDSYLSGYVDGFQVVPYPYIAEVEGLPAEVGEVKMDNTLFRKDGDKWVANYEESVEILEDLFPRDKVIFLMCGGGGYAGMMKNLLASLGWDENKIYDVGGYWYYEGKNNVQVKRVKDNGEVVYDFYKVPYHEIDFTKLTRKN